MSASDIQSKHPPFLVLIIFFSFLFFSSSLKTCPWNQVSTKASSISCFNTFFFFLLFFLGSLELLLTEPGFKRLEHPQFFLIGNQFSSFYLFIFLCSSIFSWVLQNPIWNSNPPSSPMFCHLKQAFVKRLEEWLKQLEIL